MYFASQPLFGRHLIGDIYSSGFHIRINEVDVMAFENCSCSLFL
jgi:hypothetical protein